MAAQQAAAVTHPYGAYELKLLYNQYLSCGLSFGIGIIFLCMGIYCYYHRSIPDSSKADDRTISIRQIGQQPTIMINVSSNTMSSSGVKAINAIPVPVPDEKADPEKILTDQKTLSQIPNPVIDNSHPGNISVQGIYSDIVEPEPAIDKWYPIENEPRLVHSVSAAYPEIARLSGMEGTVIVRALVDKEGKVKRAVVIQTDGEVFNQPALDAVAQYIFTPGMMNNGPVSVWVSIPFKFKLR